MQPVKPPQEENEYKNRSADCREALEGKIQQLVEESVRAGWSRAEVAAALRDIVEDTASVIEAHEE
ncbi:MULTISPECIES: hypothetical protein [unclassified Rhizobium]|uniref:hypothetical protein n=1 Tax=unclassified Rhizobium TaxID=2613769 RepID=UPI0007122EDD|nr:MULTISPECIES: hypothetical protein [unclassified Rhizobium]KQS96856.1 hypothetical protein ASG42_28665 [Rhizobium sp. Leaf391]KQT06796.1 hypothetical protein ASG50_13840 [Rhizobium sp. Leaf386]KQU05916.1 hypothetical protein ASG68_24455 [Rhizobium sp. Leaf453]